MLLVFNWFLFLAETEGDCGTKSSRCEKFTKIIGNSANLNWPIIISNDNFIIYGHHKWYSKKSIIENNINGYISTKLYNENIDVIVIDYNINKLIQKLQDYKINFKRKYGKFYFKYK